LLQPPACGLSPALGHNQTICGQFLHDSISLLAIQIGEGPNLRISQRSILEQGEDANLDGLAV